MNSSPPGGGFVKIGDYVASAELAGCPVELVGEHGKIVEATWRRVIYSEETRHLYEEAEEVVYASVGGAALKPEIKRGWRTYNFEVEDLHTYIAGGIRVHNDSLDVYAGAAGDLGTVNYATQAYDTLVSNFGPSTAAFASWMNDIGNVAISLEGLAMMERHLEQAILEHPENADYLRGQFELALASYNPYATVTSAPELVGPANTPGVSLSIEGSAYSYNAGDYGTVVGAQVDSLGNVSLNINASNGLAYTMDLATGSINGSRSCCRAPTPP